MRATLRRSCDACAKAKHGCDLRTPRCSRCTKRNISCVYANEPVTSSASSSSPASSGGWRSHGGSSREGTASASLSPSGSTRSEGVLVSELSPGILRSANSSFDPFESYPPTRLSHGHAQRLMHHFLSSIAFQYYPLDLNAGSNPFVVSWWPRALSDPALFHVSLQTASLDEELRAQKGFPVSELLMADSLSLLRRRIEDPSLAVQDETLNSVVTLAAIEHGKGNIEVARTHIEGVKRIVGIRGGIGSVKDSSSLTASMVPWVSMLVSGSPQFPVQDDSGTGSGIAPTLQWQHAWVDPTSQHAAVNGFNIDPAIRNILGRLRSIFGHESRAMADEEGLSNTELHDLTCFVVHRLLLLPPFLSEDPVQAPLSECLRYAISLYMLMIHGTTYYSHAYLAHGIFARLMAHLRCSSLSGLSRTPVGVWLISVAMAGHTDLNEGLWLTEQAQQAAIAVHLLGWEDVLALLQATLWFRGWEAQPMKRRWREILAAGLG